MHEISACEMQLGEPSVVFFKARSADLGARLNAHAAGGASIVRTWRCATKDERGLAALEIDERRAAADGYISSLLF
jgi:hypothetical protein